MKSSVFTEAAKRIKNIDISTKVDHISCCYAIEKFAGEDSNEYKLFEEIFAPKGKTTHNYWWYHPVDSNRDQDARRLALLFAAEIAKDGGL